MYSTAHKKIRNQCFEAFWYTHHLAFFFMLGLYTHATGCFVRDSVDPDYISSFPFYSTEHCLGYLSWRFIIWPGIIYFGERVWREVRARRATRLSKVLVHPSGTYTTYQRITSNISLYIILIRCHGASYCQAKFQVHRGSMAVRPNSGVISFPMAPCTCLTTLTSFPLLLMDLTVHHHLCTRGPICLRPHSSSWRFHSCAW